MSVSRDDFSIAFRSSSSKEGSRIFSSFVNIFSFSNFFLDVYGSQFTKPVRGVINDIVYRVTF